MNIISNKPGALLLLAMLAAPIASGVSAQEQDSAASDASQADITVTGTPPADLTGLTKGPEVDGMISARSGDRFQVTKSDGSNTILFVSEATKIKSSGGFLGLGSDKLAAGQLLNGLPVSVETVEWGGGLVASKIDLKKKDMKTARMISTGTAQGFAEQTAATEALRGRVGDIDKYNIKGTTNVNFAVGRADLTPQAKSELCAAASQAETQDNALMLVVGYADSTGSEEVNQTLSEKRASRVINYLQQHCGWKPYRMLTPTGMAEADPMADNSTPQGRAQNRRVAVNILVSKSVDGM